MMKKLSMLKLLTIVILLNISVSGNDFEKKLVAYEKQRISANPAVALKDLKLVFKKDLGEGWKGYLFNLSLTYQGKHINTNDILFSNGIQVTSELKKITGFDYKRLMHPTLGSEYYDKKRLIAGNSNAKNKLVVFSDPLCPNCIDDIPEIIKVVKANPTVFALYYFSFPLDMHPTAKALVKASKIAENKGLKDMTYKLYTANFEKHFDPYQEKNEQKALDTFNKIFKTNITMAELNQPKIVADLESDIKLADKAFVNGTPTLFLNGEVDITRSNYKRMIK